MTDFIYDPEGTFLLRSRKIRENDNLMSLDQYFEDHKWGNWYDEDWLIWATDEMISNIWVDLNLTREEIPDWVTQVCFVSK